MKVIYARDNLSPPRCDRTKLGSNYPSDYVTDQLKEIFRAIKHHQSNQVRINDIKNPPSM